MSESIKKIKETIAPILKKEGVIRASLFGSYARGEETANSDLDILVEFSCDKSLLDLITAENKIKTLLGKNVDLVTYSSLHPLLKESIHEDEIPLL